MEQVGLGGRERGRECSITGDVHPRPGSHWEGMLWGAKGGQVPSKHLETMGKKQGAPHPPPVLKECGSLGHALPTKGMAAS